MAVTTITAARAARTDEAARPVDDPWSLGRRPDLAVVIVTHDSADVLEDLLTSLPMGLDGLAARVVVVDNASRDTTIEVARRHRVTVLPAGGNLGYAAAINLGCGVVGPDLPLLVLNPDIRLTRGSVRRLLAAVEHGAGIAAPRLLDAEGRLHRSLRRAPSVPGAWAEALLGGPRAGRLGLGEVVHDDVAYRHRTTADWTTGAAWLLSPACRRAVEPWDERYFLYAEEVDLALRARAAGFRSQYVPSADVVHVGGDAPTSPSLWALLTRNRVRQFRTGHGRVATALFWAALVVGCLLRLHRDRHRAALRALFGGEVLTGDAPTTRASTRTTEVAA